MNQTIVANLSGFMCWRGFCAYHQAALIIVGCLFLYSFPIVSLAADESTDYCKLASEASKSASIIRGLQPRKMVPCRVSTKDEVRAELTKIIAQRLPADKLRNEELIYRALGVVDENFDYQNGILKVYLDNLGGYYDPHAEHFVMAGWLPAIVQPAIAVHELTHALQDHHYQLESFVDPKLATDELLARMALVEGDATAVMLDQTRRSAGLLPLADEISVTSSMIQTVIGAGATTTSVPISEALRLALIFPYTSGLRFVHFHLRQGGYQAIGALFAAPPRSTSEILYPETPRESLRPHLVDADSIRSLLKNSALSIVSSDTMGEFMIRGILLNGGGDRREALEAARGWRGDKVVIFNSPSGQQNIAWQTVWSSEKDRREFEVSFEKQLGRRGLVPGKAALPSNHTRVVSAVTRHELKVDGVFGVVYEFRIG